MLEMIFSGITDAITGCLDLFVSSLMVLLGFDIGKSLDYIPLFADLYQLLQWVAIGVILAIAVCQLGKFHFGSLFESKDTPVQILVRTIISVVLVYWGNYFLQMLFDLCSYPMAMFYTLDSKISNGFFEGYSKNIFDVVGGAISGLALILMALILIVVLGWNVLKLLIEAIERWLMLCLLTYTSPLVYATCASKATSAIFSSWGSMVVGQCILLWVNVWSVKILLNILSNTGATFSVILFQGVLALAFARIAQRADSYLQQLGINSATTGGSLIDAAMAVAGAATGFKRSGKDGAGGVLGAWGHGLADNVRRGSVLGGLAYAGPAGAAAAGIGKVVRNATGGMSAGEFVKKKAADAAKAAGFTGAGSNTNGSDGFAAGTPHAKSASTSGADAGSGMGSTMGSNTSAQAAGVGAENGSTSGDDTQPSAQDLGRAAMQSALDDGKSIEEATQAGLSAYDDALVATSAGAMFSMTARGMDQRDAFKAELGRTTPELRDEQARSAGLYAAERTLREGGSQAEASAAALKAYESTYGAVPEGAAMPMDAFKSDLDTRIPQMQDGASRLRINNDGEVRNGYGESMDATAMRSMSNESLARMISGSASVDAIKSGTGINSLIKNPEAYDENGNLIEGKSAMVQPEGTKMVRDIIAERGSDVSDAVIENPQVVSNQAVGAAVLQNSSMKDALSSSDEYKGLSDAISSLNNDGNVPLSKNGDPSAEIQNLKVGNGEVSFEYKPAPEQREIVKEVDGKAVKTFETVDMEVEHVSARTQQAFERMPADEQAKYHRIGGRDGAAIYVHRTVGEVEDMKLSQSGSNPNGRKGFRGRGRNK